MLSYLEQIIFTVCTTLLEMLASGFIHFVLFYYFLRAMTYYTDYLAQFALQPSVAVIEDTVLQRFREVKELAQGDSASHQAGRELPVDWSDSKCVLLHAKGTSSPTVLHHRRQGPCYTCQCNIGQGSSTLQENLERKQVAFALSPRPSPGLPPSLAFLRSVASLDEFLPKQSDKN